MAQKFKLMSEEELQAETRRIVLASSNPLEAAARMKQELGYSSDIAVRSLNRQPGIFFHASIRMYAPDGGLMEFTTEI